jgi:hypothetical protein
METKILSFQKKECLSVLQFSTSNQNTFNYVSGDSAIKDKLIEIKEINEAGSVNNIFVINNSGEFVFLSDGDVLIGAKQNRVLNTSVLLAPNSKTNIPVSCVEQGRWHHTSSTFNNSDYNIPLVMRSSKSRDIYESLKSKKTFAAVQGRIWEDVERYSRENQINSNTSNLGDLYNEKSNEYNSFVSEFKLTPNANGLAIFIRKDLVSIEVFNRTDIFQTYFPKILKGSTVEAFKLKENAFKLEQKEAEFKTLTFMDEFEQMEFKEFQGVGVGIEKRFETDKLTGAELNYNEIMIHLVAMNIKDDNKK